MDLGTVPQLRLNGLGQLFAQLNSPLVVAVDVPDDSLHKDLVLVHGWKTEKKT